MSQLSTAAHSRTGIRKVHKAHVAPIWGVLAAVPELLQLRGKLEGQHCRLRLGLVKQCAHRVEREDVAKNRT